MNNNIPFINLYNDYQFIFSNIQREIENLSIKLDKIEKNLYVINNHLSRLHKKEKGNTGADDNINDMYII